MVHLAVPLTLPELPSTLRTLATVGGTIATYSSTQITEPRLPFFEMMYRDITVRFVIVYAMPESAKSRAIEDINAALVAGRLEHRIGRTLPLADISIGGSIAINTDLYLWLTLLIV